MGSNATSRHLTGMLSIFRILPVPPMTGPTRRIFIATSVAILATLFRRSLHGLRDLPIDEGLAVDLVRIFDGDQSSARAVGREYLRQTPTEASVAKLVSLICADDTEPPPSVRSRQAICDWVSPKSRDDFRSGRVVKVHGWILSVTEARLCALSAIS